MKRRKLILLLVMFIGLLQFSLLHQLALSNSESVSMWTNIYKVSSESGSSTYANVIADKFGNVHLFWNDNSAYPYTRRTMYKMRNARGEWSIANAVPSNDAGHDVVADSKGTLHIVWYGENSFKYAYKKLSMPWSSPVSLPIPGGGGANIEIGLNDVIHIITSNKYIEKISEDNWSPVTYIFMDIPYQEYEYTYFAVDSIGQVHVVMQGRDNEIYYVYKGLDGTWSSSFNLSSNLTFSKNPNIAIDGNNRIHVVWVDLGGPDNTEIFYRTFSNGAWSGSTNASNVPGESQWAKIAVAPNGDAHIVWLELGANWGGCYYSSKLATDSLWSVPERGNYGPCYISVSETGDVHWLWASQNSITHQWRKPPSSWSIAKLNVLGEVLGMSTSSGSDNYLHLAWVSGSSFLSNWTTYYSNFYNVNVDTIDPLTIINTFPMTLTITGKNFRSTPQVYIGSSLTASILEFSANQLVIGVPAHLAAGYYTVTLKNPDGVYGNASSPLQVRNPIPIVNNISLTTTLNLRGTTMDISGENIIQTPKVFLDSIELADVMWHSSNHISALIPSTIPSGRYSITLENPGPGSPRVTQKDAITLTSPREVFIPLVLNVLR
jgi:hypothetical protein